MEQLAFQGLGWIVKLQRKRNNHTISLAKELVLGNGLYKGSELYYYLTKFNGRTAALVFLDGKGIENSKVIPIRRSKVLLENEELNRF